MIDRSKAKRVAKVSLLWTINVSLSAMQRAVTKDKDKIVFITMPDAADNGWHLYRYMCKNLTNKRFIWLCVNPNSVKHRIFECAHGSGNSVSVKRIKSVSGMREFISAGLVFLTHGLPDFLPETPNAVVVNLWHGMPIKPIGLLNKNDQKKHSVFDYTVSTSPFYTGVMAQAFEVCSRQVIESGLPRNDTLLSPSFKTKSLIVTKLGFLPTKRIVFWLPTYRKPGSKSKPEDSYDQNFLDDWNEGFLRRLDKVAERSNCIIIVKIHPLDSLNSQKFTEELSGIRLVDSPRWERLGIDLYDALAVSSALVTDLSSVLIDYAITGHPIAVTRQSYNNYSRGMIEGTSRILDGCYPIDDERSFFRFLATIDRDDCFDSTALREFNTQGNMRQSACRYLLEFLGVSSRS